MSRSYREESRRANRRWAGPVERYDLLKEFTVAFVIIAVVVVGLSVLFAAPAAKAISFGFWAQNDPQDFAQTTLTEITGTSESGSYGPPYNDGTGQVQYLGPISIQKLVGVQVPVDSAQDFVVNPLKAWSATSPEARVAVSRWESASSSQRDAWIAAVGDDPRVSLAGDRVLITRTKGDVGPIPSMVTVMLRMAQSGALDSQSVNDPQQFYGMDYTKSLLYMADGQFIGKYATQYHLQGNQWGVMNEIGQWPGQPWLWFYSLFYQIPPWSTIGTDIIVIVTVVPLVLLVMLVPFIPGLRDLPRWIGLYKLIWRDYYKDYGRDE